MVRTLLGMKVTARYEGPSLFQDLDPATLTDEPIPSGGVFETTKDRFEQLKKLGKPVVLVVDAKQPKEGK